MKTLLLSTAATALLALAPAAAQTQETPETQEREAPAATEAAPQTESQTDAEQYPVDEAETPDELTADNEDFRADRAPGQAAMADEEYGPETEQAAVPEEEPGMETQDTMADRMAADRQETAPEGEDPQMTAQEELTPVPPAMETAEDAETLNRLQQEELAEKRRADQDETGTQTADQDMMGQDMQGQEMMGEGQPMMRPQDRMAQGMDDQRMDRQAPDLESAALIYRSTAALNPTAVTAEELLGADLVNEAGERLARVEDVIIDQQGAVQGVILAAGGLFGLGEDNYAIEFNRIQGIRTGEEIEIVSQLSERDISRLRKFDLDDFEEDMGSLMMASELRGMELPIGRSEETASVEDVVMSRAGQVEALVVSYDGDRYVAPFSEIGVAEGAGGLYIDTEPRLIGAMAVYQGLTGFGDTAGQTGQSGQTGDTMTRTPAAPGAMDRDAGMQPRMQRDRRMQDAPVAPDENRMKRGDMTEQGMGKGTEPDTDDSMGMGEELGTEEEPGGGNQ